KEEVTDISNQSDALVFVSIHCNSFTDPKIYGLRVYYEVDEKTTKDLYRASSKLAQRVVAATQSAGVKSSYLTADYQVLRDNNKPSILVETGFMTNPDELERLINDEYQTKIMQAVCDGVLSYIKNDMPKPAAQ
ncbi:MAG: N-acetylmuramoyl-L-alanine amidase, partial [Oscillospiraceae bacterium]|nr:N-acetylmuramoyl-L-alanine amidase [Oscillospiraceae bacterium]